MEEAWRELGAGVFVRRHQSLDLNVGLIVGPSACAVIDTRLSHVEGRDLAAAVRRITTLPWLVVNTHGHFDHCFGNAVFAPAEIWGHERTVRMLNAHGEIKRRYFARTRPELDDVEITPPNRTLSTEVSLDLGGRTVRLRHLGLGHTDNDIVVEVPDADVVFAGDLVEEGAPPVFNDAFPLDWPSTLDRLAASVTGAVVPGHGDVVDRSYVEQQAALLAAVAAAARSAYETGQPAEMPLPPDFADVALERAFRQLRGDPPNESPDELRRRLDVS
jgi:glyoxylase-like metal-dependent hydrolase (beta-lactamase superfamily II)